MTTASESKEGAGAVPAGYQNPYDQWIESLGVPIHAGYYIEDGRTVKLGRWEERECDAAFLQLAGQQGVTGCYITEIAPGQTLPPFRLAIDEVVYVMAGRGLATVWGGEDGARKTFEWQTHSMFLVPGGYTTQLSNVQGTQPARLFHSNYLPLAMTCVVPEVDFFLDNPKVNLGKLYGNRESEFYSEAKAAVRQGNAYQPVRTVWIGNFFPDMRAWDKLDPLRSRGAGGLSVNVDFPGSPITAHMSVFPPLTYKKAHRHGPGFAIIIPAGEGYSIMWPDGGEKVVIPWHEASIFVPPMRWWHQHFNVNNTPDRYLAIHPPRPLMMVSEKIEDMSRDQKEYVDEDPWVRELFESELTKRGLKSQMPEEAYRNREYQWVDLKV